MALKNYRFFRVLLTGGVGGKGKGVLGASDRFLVYDLVLVRT